MDTFSAEHMTEGEVSASQVSHGHACALATLVLSKTLGY